jgi:glutamate/tyrosine decarboxylase-like PLP-dependent enzyme
MRDVELISRALESVESWEASWGPFDPHPASEIDGPRLREALDEYVGRLRGNYPFFHPRYAGQMLKPPHPVARLAYAAAQRINPNNHALDGGPPTGEMEKEVVALLAAMFGLPGDTLGHLTGGGTVANLEALYVARHLHPDKAVAFSEDAHYTHARMCEVLGLRSVSIATDGLGHMDLDALERELRTGAIGSVVATPGTTGLGAVDPLAEIVPLARRHGARVHADAAYGGFFTLLAHSDHAPPDFPAGDLRALAEVDSIVVDPHKHGLQPYGCGCVLFRDPAVGRFYRHDSPYTYFTSDELHLGEISLECSRAGATAGALWLTLRVLPLAADDGIGPILGACLRASRAWADAIEASNRLDLFARPELDIVTFFPRPAGGTLSEVDAASRAVFRRAMADTEDPVFLSLYRLPASAVAAQYPDLERDCAEVTVLRSVLMKPEHEAYVPHLHARIEAVAAAV